MSRRPCDPAGRLLAAMYAHAEGRLAVGKFDDAYLGVGDGAFEAILQKVNLTKNEAAQLLRLAEVSHSFVFSRQRGKRKVYLVLRAVPSDEEE